MDLFDEGRQEKSLKTINEVSSELDLESYVLRFWETKFKELSPNKGKGGRRIYSKKDVEILKKIKNLLYKQGFTIEGAKKVLEDLNINHLGNNDTQIELKNIAPITIEKESITKEKISTVILELKELKQELDSFLL